MASGEPVLLSVIELGGYPDFSGLYRKTGFQVVTTESVRKAVKLIRKYKPAVIVAEFNFQSDFRDRTSSLETLFSSLQGVSDARVIVFYEKEYRHQYEKLLSQFRVFESLEFPVNEARLGEVLRAAMP
jgi:DNA-binding NtrC family response regulator